MHMNTVKKLPFVDALFQQSKGRADKLAAKSLVFHISGQKTFLPGSERERGREGGREALGDHGFTPAAAQNEQ